MKTPISGKAIALALSLALPAMALAQQATEPAKSATEAKPVAGTPVASPTAVTEATNAAAVPVATPAAAPIDKDKEPRLQGFRLSQRPVVNLKQARIYAGEWVIAGYLADMTVGKVRNVGGLYIADLVLKAQPKSVANQLLIRKRDGFGILVYPGRPKAPTPEAMVSMAGMAGMVGMAGMEGMSGMSGMKPLQAKPSAHGNFRVKSARHARRVVDAWLLLNGLPSLYAGRTRDLGGIYVTQIVTGKGALKNQAVMRKSDAFIQLIHPVASIGAKK